MEFLKSFSNTVFQVFPDKGSGYAKIFERYDEAEFKKLNKDGRGIYFTPNGFKGGRKAENLVSINAVYADLDVAKEGGKGDKQPIINALLTDKIVPNFIIDTKNGVQAIWLIESTTNKDLCVKVMKGIIEWSKKFGCMGDRVYDLTRVLRLPGYYHMKGEPYMCTAEKYTDDILPIEFMEEAFPYEEKKKKYVAPPLKVKKHALSMAIDRVDFEELIIRAFASIGRTASFTSSWQLVLDGRKTGTHRGKTGDCDFLASNSHEPFVGNRITATADILGVTNKQARAWIIEEFGLKEREDVRKKEVAKEEVKEITKELEEIKPKKRGYYTWGTKSLTESFAPIKSDTFALIGAGYGVGKTTFCVDVAIKNAQLGHRVLYLSLEMSKEELMDQFGRNAAGITIPEEIYNKIPEGKLEKYKQRREEIESIKTFSLKGFKGGKKVNWECLVELMAGDWDLIFVDNFNLIAKEDGVSKYDHEGDLSKKFLNYAAKQQTPILVVHHYSKGGAREEIKTGYSLSGNAEVQNDSTRIVLLDRKRFEIDDEPTKKDKATLKVMLDKGRGYDRGINRLIYFYKGSFYDEFPEEKAFERASFWQNK